MNNDVSPKGTAETKPSRSFFGGLTPKLLLSALLFAIVSTAIGMSLMTLLFDAELNFAYGAILATCLFVGWCWKWSR